MSGQKLRQFLASLHGEHKIYDIAWMEVTSWSDLKRGTKCMRVYRNTDGTWSLMPNWFKTTEQTHKRASTTNYETFDDMPVPIQEKLSVLMLKDPGSEWLSGVGKRIDNGVFWLEDG